MRTDCRLEQSTKHRGKGGGSTFPELPDQLRGGCPFVENLHPRFGRLARFQPQPQCSRRRCSLIGRSRSINQSFQSISLGGRGRGRRPEGGSEGLGVGVSGLPVWTGDWTGPAGGCRRCRPRNTGTGRCARVGQEPCPPHAPPLHPAPCTSELWATSLAPPTPTTQSQTTPLGHPHTTRVQAASTLPVAYLSQHQTHTPTPWISIITAARRTMFFLFWAQSVLSYTLLYPF